jgi:NAD(P)-dependent dehydrogenase (short-subunit alcohol dehydrogenase family)
MMAYRHESGENGQPVALVTGGNRGLGLEFARQLAQQDVIVVIGSRRTSEGKKAQQLLKDEGLNVVTLPLDVTDSQSIATAEQSIAEQFGKLDMLINNAGILPDADSEATPTTVDPDTVLEIFKTNTLGPLRVCQAMIPLLKQSPAATIINVSSGLGSLTEMEGGYPGYRISKAALNAVTRILAAELSGTSVLVHSICPGWVQTDMGGPNATRTPKESVAGVLPLLLKPHPELNGLFLRDGKPIPW